ncbi:FISUMP domain-containing protein [Fibrobacter sp.]|uniref:FISUMP domain-containing protein n=1 Tax=Fibrobacter sp. TaxID=35828 RepID=UPI00388D73F0
MRKSFQRVIATLNLFQGKQSLAIFLLAAIFALSACDDSSSAGDDDGETSVLSSAEGQDYVSSGSEKSSSSSGKVTDKDSDAKSSDSKGNPSSAGTSTKSSNSNTSGNDAKSSSSAGKEVSSSSEEMKTAWDYLNPDIDYGEFTDERDGQVYKTVKIGDQVWMAQNLNYAYIDVPYNFSYNNNVYISDSTSWCYLNGPANCAKYGRLYTWAAAMDSVGEWSTNGKGCGYGKTCSPTYPVRGICPKGWHLPSNDEWKALFTRRWAVLLRRVPS